jgi:rubredoxin
MKTLRIKIEAECPSCGSSYSAYNEFPIIVAESITRWDEKQKCFICRNCEQELDNDIL